MTEPSPSTVDPSEVERFARIAADWWNPRGKFKPLHVFNPVRLSYIRDRLLGHFVRDGSLARPFSGLGVLDVGCGGGLLTEPLARLGASVTGIDPSDVNVGVARHHAGAVGLDIDYRATSAEELARSGARYDVVLAMEVVEHVADVPLFLHACAELVAPGGLLFVATINRTMKAYALAIVGAEYVLGWLPRGTHAYDRLVRPEEVIRPLEAAGLGLLDTTGVGYDPLRDRWRLVADTAVNYMVLFARPA